MQQSLVGEPSQPKKKRVRKLALSWETEPFGCRLARLVSSVSKIFSWKVSPKGNLRSAERCNWRIWSWLKQALVSLSAENGDTKTHDLLFLGGLLILCLKKAHIALYLFSGSTTNTALTSLAEAHCLSAEGPCNSRPAQESLSSCCVAWV